MLLNFSVMITPFENFLKNRPNLVLIDSETENGIIFLILKSEDTPSEILGIQTSNRELVSSFAYLEKLILTLISSLHSMQENLIDE